MNNRTYYSPNHVHSHLAIYFSSPFGSYPTFHTLTSVVRKKLFQYVYKILPLFHAVVKLCRMNRLLKSEYIELTQSTIISIQYSVVLFHITEMKTNKSPA